RLPLIFGQRLQDPPPAISPEEPFDSLIVFCAFVLTVVTISWSVCSSRQIESLGLQSSPSQKGLSVGHLSDPGTCRTSRAIEQRTFPVDIKEPLLDKIVRLTTIAKDSSADCSNRRSKAPKQL